MPTKKPRGHPLSPKLLADYRDAAIINAGELIAEAETLLEGHHHARAYFLAGAAIEEVGKAVQAAQGIGRNLTDPAVRTMLQTQFETHSSKVTSAFIPWMLASTDLQAEVMDFISTALDVQQGREPSMYVDINPQSLLVVIPRVVVRSTAASNCVALARAVLERAKPYVESAAAQTYTRQQDAFFSMNTAVFNKMAHTADFWEYYLSRIAAGDKAVENAVIDYHLRYFTKSLLFKPSPPADGDA